MTQPTTVLVVRSLDLGGIETLVVRLAGEFSKQGQPVIVVSQDGVLKANLAASTIHLGFDAVSNSEWDRLANVMAERESEAWYFISVDPPTRFIAESLVQALLQLQPALEIKHISGCFHPRTYCHDGEIGVRRFVNRRLGNYLGNGSLFFMNEIVRSSHQAMLKGIADDALIATIPVSVPEEPWKVSQDNQVFEIISVGRLVAFKQYIFGVVEAVNALIAKGYSLRLTIYGHGELEQALIEAIAALPNADAVTFKGALPYESFAGEVRRYDLFIGMGTAAAEAAASGVPTLVTIDSDKDQCYGYLQQVPFGTFGEVLEGAKRVRFEDAIKDHIRLTSEQQQAIGMQGRALYQSLSMAEYVAALKHFLDATTPVRASRTTRFLLRLYFVILYRCSRLVGSLVKRR